MLSVRLPLSPDVAVPVSSYTALVQKSTAHQFLEVSVSCRDVPLVAVNGDIARPRYLPAWEGMTVSQAVAHAGGRRAGSSNRGVYLIREGLSRYYADLETADTKMTPEPGDIIQLSKDF